MIFFHSIISLCLALMLVGCEGAGSDPLAGGKLGENPVTGIPISDSGNPGAPEAPSGSNVDLGESCSTTDPEFICLALRYVVYENSSGTSVISAQQAIRNIEEINEIWSACKIGFQIDDFLPVDPTEYGLNYNTLTAGEMSLARGKFVNSRTLLVVTTGAWSGSLGAGSANAWTSLPGSSPYGVVLEAAVGDYSNIIGHELGHYLNLDHYANTSNLMNAVIYDSSNRLTQSQCNAARSAAQSYWRSMYR